MRVVRIWIWRDKGVGLIPTTLKVLDDVAQSQFVPVKKKKRFLLVLRFI